MSVHSGAEDLTDPAPKMTLVFVRPLLMPFLVVLAISGAASADPRDNAKAAVQTFFEAWNTAQIDAVRATLNYPHITLAGARMNVAYSPSDFQTDFARMQKEEGWASSSLDAIAFGEVSAEKANCLVTYSRKNADGAVYRTGTIAYIITNRDGRWGMQFRAPVGEIVGEDSAAVRSARRVLDEFFDAFNAADNARLQPLSNYPHVFLLADGRVALAEGPDDLVMDFDAMRGNEGWAKSTLDSADVVHATAEQVHFDIVFSRLHQMGRCIAACLPGGW